MTEQATQIATNSRQRQPIRSQLSGEAVVGTVDVILPALNEELALPELLAALPAGMRPIVVDNGSTDHTAEVARGYGASVVSEPRRGYGAAVHAGTLAATADVVVFMDADGSIDPGDISVLLADLIGHDADMVVGARRPAERGVWPWHARLGNALVAGILRRRGIPVSDLAPVRVVRRDRLLALGLVDRGFGYPLELLISAGAAGWRIRELPVRYGRRAAGSRSKVSGSVIGTFRALRDMARVLR